MVLAQLSLSAVGCERQQRDGYDPFAKPSRKGRFLRTADVHCVVFARLKSREGDLHLPEGEGAKLTRRSMGTRVLR